MNHDHDVRACGQREPVARLLIRAIAAVHRMHFHLHAIQRAGDRHGFILARIIHHDDKIDNIMRHHFFVSLAQSARGVIRRHHYDDLLAIEHRFSAGSNLRRAPSALLVLLSTRRRDLSILWLQDLPRLRTFPVR